MKKIEVIRRCPQKGGKGGGGGSSGPTYEKDTDEGKRLAAIKKEYGISYYQMMQPDFSFSKWISTGQGSLSGTNENTTTSTSTLDKTISADKMAEIEKTAQEQGNKNWMDMYVQQYTDDNGYSYYAQSYDDNGNASWQYKSDNDGNIIYPSTTVAQEIEKAKDKLIQQAYRDNPANTQYFADYDKRLSTAASGKGKGSLISDEEFREHAKKMHEEAVMYEEGASSIGMNQGNEAAPYGQGYVGTRGS